MIIIPEFPTEILDYITRVLTIEQKFTIYRIDGKHVIFPFRLRNAFEMRSDRLKRRLKDIANAVEFKCFITLTFDKEGLQRFSGSGKEISELLKNLRQYPRCIDRILKLGRSTKKRQYKPGSALKYVWKYEEGFQHSRPHFHLLVDRPIPKCAIHLWGNGFIQFKLIKNSMHAIAYVSKYMSKHSYTTKFKRGSRVCGSNVHPLPSHKTCHILTGTAEEIIKWQNGSDFTLQPYVYKRKP